MVRITDTGQAELDAYVASSGPVVPKTSGYGALDTRPTPQKAAAPTNVPNYTTSPGGLPNNLAPLRPFNPAPVAPQYGGYQPTDYDLGLAPKITPQQFTDIDRYMGGVTDPFTPMVDRYASPAIDLAQQLNPSRWFEPDWISPTPDWMNAGDSAQTSQYVPPGGIAPGPSGFLPNLGVAAASFGNIMDAPRKYLSAPLAGNLLEQFDNPLDVVSALGKGPLGVIQQGIADTATPGGYRSGGENWDTQIGKLPEPLQVGANIAIDPLTWLGPGAIKGGLQGSRFANIADTLLTQPASVGLGQVAGGTGGALAADAFDLGPGGETAAILAGTILGGGLGPAGVRGLGAAARNAPDAARNLAGTNPFAAPTPSAFDLPSGAIDPTTGRPFEWQSPMGGADDLDAALSKVRAAQRAPEDARYAAMDEWRAAIQTIDNQADLKVALEKSDAYLREVQQQARDVINGPLTGRIRGDEIERTRMLVDEARSMSNQVLGRSRYLRQPPPAELDVPKIPETPISAGKGVVGQESYFMGSRVRYLDGPDADGYYRVEALDGYRKGQILLTTTAPDGSNPIADARFAENVRIKNETEARFRKMRESGNYDQMPPTKPKPTADEAISQSLAQPKVEVPFEGQRAILDALQEQIRFRESGAAEELIRQGRRTQAQGISGALAQGGTLDEVLQGTAAGARVGPMLPTGSPLNIAPEAIQSATDSIVKLGLDSPFDTMTSLRAFNKLLNGQKLQPKEIKLLGKVFGSDVEDLIRRTNANRIAIKAELTPADMAEITRRAEVDGKRVARLEVEAQAQHKLANQLRERARMNPTNKQLAKAADDAQARALKLETDAERLLIDRANRAEVKAIRKAQETAQRSAAQASQKALRADLSAEYKSSGAQALENATRMINESDASPLLKQQVTRAMEVWMEANGKILDSLGDDAPTVLRRIYAAATGELTDSWTQKLIIETGFMRNALEESGYHPDLARSIVRQLQDAEVARRFGDNIPKHVQDSLDQLRLGQDTAAVTAQSLGGISQVLKNTTLGIGDLAVFGQQGVKLSITNVVPLLAGTINRALHLAGAGMDVGFTANNLPKRVQNALDGLQTSSRGIVDFGTAAADDLSGSKYTTLSKAAERAKGGTVVSLIPGIGKTIDRPIVAATEFLTDLQFKHVLGWARSTVYEGNLMMLKAAGEDITDPLVRQRAANWANVASGAADLATRATRREVERAGFLSPALTRAQVQQGGQVIRGLKAWLEDPLWAPTFGKVTRNLDSAARVDRVLAASTVVGTAASALLIGKLLNDWIGVTDFEFDPSEGGFGNITLPNGTVVNVFSQTQVPKALARSLRILVEDGVTADDVGPLLTEIGKLAVGRSSPAARLIGQAFDTGFNPDEGYQFGDLDMNWRQQLLSNLTPPIVQSVVREGVDAVRTPLEALGFSAYEESEYTTRDRAIAADPRFNDENGQPRKYSELSPSEKREAISLHGATEPFGEEGRQAAEVTAEILEKQKASDQRLDSGELTPEQWKNDYNDRRHDLFVLKDFIYRDLDLKPGDDPILDGYYAAIEGAERPDGTVDWDQVDRYMDGLSKKEVRHVRENTGLINLDTPEVRKFEAARDRIEDAGWFERTDESWANVVSYYPELGRYDSYYAWRDAQRQPLIEAWTKEYGFSPEFARLEADKYLDEQQPATDYDFYAKQWREAWVEANPQAAYDAWKYGYYTPTDAYAEWLNQMYQGGYVK